MVGKTLLPFGNFARLATVLLLSCVACQIRAAEGDAEEPYFKTHFQDECQFIVETICTDLAEMFYYAKNHSLPSQPITAEAKEETDAPPGNLSYRITIKFGSKETSLRLELAIDQPIWDARVYEPLAVALAQKFGVKKDSAKETNSAAIRPSASKLIEGLLELNGTNIEVFNQQISQALAQNFFNCDLHEQAALLLGAFGLREGAGHFSDTRMTLCRMTAHLAFARALDRSAPAGVSARLADAVLYALMCNQRDVMQRCDELAKTDPQLAGWIRALRTFANLDYRPLRQFAPMSHLERIAFSSAGATLNGADSHMRDLMSWEFQADLDAIRLFAEHHYSASTGYVLFQHMKLQWQELADVVQLARREKFEERNLASLLNPEPERCVSLSSQTQAVVKVIGWGHWAFYFQRHLLHAIPHSYEFMTREPGFRKDAEEWLARYRTLFKGLTLAPALDLFLARNEPAYHKAVEDGIALTVAVPHLISPELWVDISHQSGVYPYYQVVPNDHISEWHKHDPPPGTVHAMRGRSYHLSVRGGRKNSTERLEQLHEMAPYDRYISGTILRIKSRTRSDIDDLLSLFEPILDYSATAWSAVFGMGGAQTRLDDLLKEKPNRSYAVGQILMFMNPDAGFELIQSAIDKNADPITGAYLSQNLIYQYLRKDMTKKAEQVANWAAKVPCESGLRAKIRFLRAVGRVDEAVEASREYEERYGDSRPLAAAFKHYRYKTHDHRYDADVEKRLTRLFPKGITKVGLTNFTDRPLEGVVVTSQDEFTMQAGLKLRDIAVAVCGVRVYDWYQYDFARYLEEKPQTKLIVWDGSNYIETSGEAAAEPVIVANTYNMTGAPVAAASRKK